MITFGSIRPGTRRSCRAQRPSCGWWKQEKPPTARPPIDLETSSSSSVSATDGSYRIRDASVLQKWLILLPSQISRISRDSNPAQHSLISALERTKRHNVHVARWCWWESGKSLDQTLRGSRRTRTGTVSGHSSWHTWVLCS